MRKTLLLVFIHGFKVRSNHYSGNSSRGSPALCMWLLKPDFFQGGNDTFGTFPEHLQALISHALPKVDVVSITYPKFETRGELKECVSRFRDW
jgi:hypothetical protein